MYTRIFDGCGRQALLWAACRMFRGDALRVSGRCGIMRGMPIQVPGLAGIMGPDGNWQGAAVDPAAQAADPDEAVHDMPDLDPGEDGHEGEAAAAPQFRMGSNIIYSSAAEWLAATFHAHHQAVAVLEFTQTPVVWQHRADGSVDMGNLDLDRQQQADGEDVLFEHGEALLMVPTYLYGNPCLFGTAAAQATEEVRRRTATAGSVTNNTGCV